MASIVITEAEIRDALAEATNGPKEARTVQELVSDTGVAERRVRRALKALQIEGRLQAHTVRRPDLSGRMQPVPAYAILPAKRQR